MPLQIHVISTLSCCVHAGCRIVGLEIVEGARPVHEHPFCGPTAFMLGNEVRIYVEWDLGPKTLDLTV